MPKKIRVGVIFGGRSGEHEVSLVSGTSVINALDKDKYEIIPIGITKEGKWLSSAETMKLLKSGQEVDHAEEKILVPDPTQKSLVALNHNALTESQQPLDVIFPVLHGPFGEDGTVQGLLELANIPYVGGGVLASSVGMDKVVQKELFRQAGIPVADSVFFLSKEYDRSPMRYLEQVEARLGYPCFIKPANLGSSVGISKAHNPEELMAGIEDAAQYDRKILVEESIENVREIECSVLGNDDPIASLCGEILPSNEFYDYDAKYVDGKSQAIIPANIPDSVMKEVQRIAVTAFKVTDCAGMARVDFLVKRDTHAIYLNEINTIPGFTSISMYPKLWEASGLPYAELLDRLIELAIERHQEKSKLKTSYQPKDKWYNK
jgi:D-alanine-D-alanine ligase